MPYSPFQTQRLDSASLRQNLPWFQGWGQQTNVERPPAMPVEFGGPTAVANWWSTRQNEQAREPNPAPVAAQPPAPQIIDTGGVQFAPQPQPETPNINVPAARNQASWWSAPAPKASLTMPKFTPAAPTAGNIINLDPRESGQFENDWWNAAKSPQNAGIFPGENLRIPAYG